MNQVLSQLALKRATVPRRLMPHEYLLEHGVRYTARLRLGIFERTQENARVAETLTDAGFYDVEVAGEGAVREARMLWPNPTGIARLPDQVAEIREAR